MAAMNKKGFTIVELLVSILLTSIIMGAVYSVYRVQTHSAKIQENRLEAQEYARSVLDMMVREIRNAAYNPLAISAAALGTGCGAFGNGAPGVVTATDTSIRFTYDFQGTTPPAPPGPDGDCNDADEDITYAFDPTGCPTGFGNITRKAGSGAAQALTDCNVPTGASNFSFAYYPQQTSGTAPAPFCASLGDPAGCSGDLVLNLTNIQRILISLTVQSKNPDAEFGGQLTATVASNADLRNRGLPS